MLTPVMSKANLFKYKEENIFKQCMYQQRGHAVA
jgi:hypothetical protein